MEVINTFFDEIDKFLDQPGPLNTYLTLIEQKTSIKRHYLVKGFLTFFMLYMIFGYFAALICNFLGFIYPAYTSMKALESSSKEDDTRWLTYWVVFAAFSVIEFFSDIIFSWFPFYWLAKVIFLIWCYLPIEENGTNFVYEKILRPLFLKRTQQIDQTISGLKKKVGQEVKEIMTKKD